AGSDWGISSTPVPTDVGPGEQVKISFRVNAPLVAGTYNLSTKMYVHTVAFGVPSPTVPVAVTVQPDAARFISHNVPTTVKAGSTFSVTVDMRNVGPSTWTFAGGYGLSPVSGSDGWGVTMVPLGAGDSIAPGQDKVFTFNCQAPAAAGNYTMRWQLNHQGVA